MLAAFAFAGNSLLCRLAFKGGLIDAASFTTLRLVSGAITLYVLVRAGKGCVATGPEIIAGDACWHFVYAVVSLCLLSTTATGALLLFARCRPVNDDCMGFWQRLRKGQIAGVALAFGWTGWH
jgi:hypothetical protein